MYRVEVTYWDGTGSVKTVTRNFNELEESKDKARTWSELPTVKSVKVTQIEEYIILEIDGPAS